MPKHRESDFGKKNIMLALLVWMLLPYKNIREQEKEDQIMDKLKAKEYADHFKGRK